MNDAVACVEFAEACVEHGNQLKPEQRLNAGQYHPCFLVRRVLPFFGRFGPSGLVPLICHGLVC